MTIKHLFIGLCIVLGCAAVLFIQSCSKDPTPEVQKGNDAPASIDVNGHTVAFAPNAPQLQQFTIDTVKETTMRLTLSAPVHNLVSIVKSESGNNKLYLFETQDITDTYTNYLTAEANLEHSSLALKRVKDLYAHDIAASRDLQDAEQDYTAQQSAVADNTARLRAAGIDPKALQGTLSGTIWVIADISEGEVTSISPGMNANVHYVSYPGENFLGHVSQIGDVIDPNTRKVKVRIALANANNKLHAAMFGTVQFTESPRKAVTIPVTAVVREGDGTLTAWATTDGCHFEQRIVTIGVQDSNRYQIISGLKPGEIVVSMGGVFLSNMLSAPPED